MATNPDIVNGTIGLPIKASREKTALVAISAFKTRGTAK
jgi:hypothetical protein